MRAGWLVSLVALALPGAASAQTQPPTQTPPPDQAQTPQVLFGGLVVDDPRTTPAMRDLVRSGAAYIATPQFADLTGDGRMDAVVQVRMPGAAGTVGVFVFSTQGTSEGRLRSVFRSQALYRATVRTAPGTLLVTVPEYASGDDVCCPAAREERRYGWDARTRTLRRR